MTKYAWCETCEAVQPVTFEPLTDPDPSGRFRGGDLVCDVCGLVIATLYEPIADSDGQR